MALADSFAGKKLAQIKDGQLKNAVIVMAKEISSPNDIQSLQKMLKSAAVIGSGCLVLIVKV